MKIDSKNLHEMSNALRADALRAIAAAKSGHVGIVLGAADIVTMIYAVFLNPVRDRFVLSAGHGSAMLYAALKLAGYNIGDLKSFRQIGGPPGHPEFGIDGVSATTGPLGQGVANAVGMAIAAKHNKTGGTGECNKHGESHGRKDLSLCCPHVIRCHAGCKGRNRGRTHGICESYRNVYHQPVFT